MKPRIAIDLDSTLGCAVIHDLSNEVLGFRLRPHCIEVLERLQGHYSLCLWTISSRWYVDKVLGFGLGKYFAETYSWDELPGPWKDIRKINVTHLIDDQSHHRAMRS